MMIQISKKELKIKKQSFIMERLANLCMCQWQCEQLNPPMKCNR